MGEVTIRKPYLPAALSLVLLLGACSGDEAAFGGGGGDTPVPPPPTVKTFRICPGPNAQTEAIIAFFDAHEGDTIEFCAGQFDFTSGLVMFGKKGITIRGAGMNQTFLRFKNSSDQDGLNLNRMTGVIVQGLTIYDAPGNGLRVFRSDIITIRDVKVGWSISDPFADSVYGAGTYNSDPASWSGNGAYAFYPVICHKVLIEDSISVGSSDAGVYVGQSSDILVRRTEAFHNVAGFEFENTYRAEFVDNYAHDNVGGFLVFDLPGRVQFGEKNLVHHNRSYNNNIPQFAPRGSIVAYVPSGTGALLFASDQLEFYANDIKDNDTVGIAIANYGLADSAQSQKRYDFFPEGLHIYGNTLTNNGSAPQVPDPNRATCTGPNGMPGPGDEPDCVSDNAGLLVTIIQLKNGGKSAQIIWDGGVDVQNDSAEEQACAAAPRGGMPVDSDGIPLSEPNPGETRDERYEARMDERGRPNLYQYDPEPACDYDAWKFDASGALKKPENGLCIEGNTFNKTTPQAMLVDDYANIHFATADPTEEQNQQPADHDIPTDCPTVAAVLLPQFVPVLGSYTPNPANDPRPSEAERAAVCGAVQAGQVNRAAIAKFNCPRLDQYGLFANAQDPTQNPNGGGVPFELNTILFSDYASKSRFLFLPPGGKATFMDHEDCETLNIYDCYTATLGFPVGTVFAKTFSFKDGDAMNVVETRLLIKRQAADGTSLWTGFAYEWKSAADGSRFAELKIEGATRAVSWNYDDEDPAAQNLDGNRPHYEGETANYGVPSASACLLCHGGDDREAGTAPIGLKVRNLNRDNVYGGQTINQLAYLQTQGLLDLPAGMTPASAEHMVKWNVPGSGPFAADSPEDKNARARAYLEVNCMHCHNPAGAAQNSGLRLDGFTHPLDFGHGLCKPPIAAGRGADSGNYDIDPGDAALSILVNRVESVEAGVRMPPLARSVAHGEAASLLNDWVENVLPLTDADGNPVFVKADENFCGESGPGTLPIPLMAPVAPTAAQKAPWG